MKVPALIGWKTGNDEAVVETIRTSWECTATTHLVAEASAKHIGANAILRWSQPRTNELPCSRQNAAA
jgi:hypothetical protein